MNVLFVHNNFPAQFGHVVRALSQDKQTKVVAIGSATAREMPNVKLLKYYLTDADVAATHPFARRFDLECRRAEQVLYAASSLASSEFIPDVIVAHPGWGESLPLRAIFPKAYLLAYCEFFYAASDRDVGFDPEFAEIGIDGHVTLHLKNAATLLTLADCDLGYSPTAWQRSTFPHEYRDKIRIIHEGVDIELAKPEPGASFQLTSGHELTPSDEVVTFVARNFEPLRGYHIFMRALPRILAKRPRAQVLIIGGDGAPYGMVPPEGQTWKSIFFNEVASRIDQRRVHFTGYLQHADYIRALQISSAHVYLTYPFVLSWSVVEALSVGCVVIASDTAPVREIINPEENGILVPFFDVSQLADRVIEVLAHPGRFRAVRENARRAVEEKYDMRNCVPKLMKILTTRPAASPTSKNRRRPA